MQTFVHHLLHSVLLKPELLVVVPPNDNSFAKAIAMGQNGLNCEAFNSVRYTWKWNKTLLVESLLCLSLLPNVDSLNEFPSSEREED